MAQYVSRVVHRAIGVRHPLICLNVVHWRSLHGVVALKPVALTAVESLRYSLEACKPGPLGIITFVRWSGDRPTDPSRIDRKCSVAVEVSWGWLCGAGLERKNMQKTRFVQIKATSSTTYVFHHIQGFLRKALKKEKEVCTKKTCWTIAGLTLLLEHIVIENHNSHVSSCVVHCHTPPFPSRLRTHPAKQNA